MKERLSPKRKLVYNLIKSCFWGVLALISAFWFVFYNAGNPYHEYLLITKGITTQGFITDATEDVTDDDRGKAHFRFYYTYTFTSDDGRKFNSGGNIDGRLPDELSDLSDPYPTDIVYLKVNPEINKLKNTLCKSIGELLWRKVGLGTILLILFSSIGFVLLRNAIKEYLNARKNLRQQRRRS